MKQSEKIIRWLLENSEELKKANALTNGGVNIKVVEPDIWKPDIWKDEDGDTTKSVCFCFSLVLFGKRKAIGWVSLWLGDFFTFFKDKEKQNDTIMRISCLFSDYDCEYNGEYFLADLIELLENPKNIHKYRAKTVKKDRAKEIKESLRCVAVLEKYGIEYFFGINCYDKFFLVFYFEVEQVETLADIQINLFDQTNSEIRAEIDKEFYENYLSAIEWYYC